MAKNLYEVLQWVKSNGEPMALVRMRLKLLPLTVREGIVLEEVSASTPCSAAYLSATRAIASEVVGSPCP